MNSITIAMGPDDLPQSKAGNPELPTKNRHFGFSKFGGKYITPRGKAFRKALEAMEIPSQACTGLWSLTLVVYTQRRGGKLADIEDEAGCDSDACLAPVRDALEAVGIIDNDARIVSNRCASVYTGKAGLRIELRQLVEREEWAR